MSEVLRSNRSAGRPSRSKGYIRPERRYFDAGGRIGKLKSSTEEELTPIVPSLSCIRVRVWGSPRKPAATAYEHGRLMNGVTEADAD